MGPVVGIDLGTTNTVVAAVRKGQAFALGDESGRKLIPSIVSFHPSGRVLVGQAARERRLIDPQNTIYSVKRLIGRAWSSAEVRQARARFPFEMREGPGQATLVAARDETYTLPEISAFVLRQAKSIAESALGEPVERAVITVPANFNDLQRAATKVAGRVAGLEVLRILNEPTAAALAYGYGRKRAERVAIYDFGGGTFDVTLLDMSSNVFEVLATAGNTFLGGDDLDLAILEKMADEFLVQHNQDPRGDSATYERLRAGAETLKSMLSDRAEATLEIPELGHGVGGAPLGLTFSMSRRELERLALPIVDRTFDVCREALGIARLAPEDFDQVLLVGGSTRMPLVKNRVEEFFRRAPLGSISPDEVVAIGAAIQAHALTSAERRRSAVPPAPVPGASMPPRPLSIPDLGNMAEPPSLAPQTHPYAQNPRPIVAPSPDAAPVDSMQFSDSGRKRGNTATGLGAVAAGIPAAPSPPDTLAGLGARGRVRTGAGLGPAAAQARERGEAETEARSASGTGPMPTATLTMTSPVPPPAPARPVPATTLASAGAQANQARQATSTTEESVRFALDDNDLIDSDDEATGIFLPSVVSEGSSSKMRAAAPADVLALERDLPVPALPRDALPALPSVPQAPREALPALPSVPQAPREALPALPNAMTRTLTLGVPAPSAPAPSAPPPKSSPLSAPPPKSSPMHTMPLAAVPGSEPRIPIPSAAPPPLLVDVTPLSLAVETLGGYTDVLIERNRPVPCENTRSFVTASDNQTSVLVRVSQGEARQFGANTLLGEVELGGLAAAPRGHVEVLVTFSLDTDGMLNVRATDRTTGRAASAVLRLVGVPDQGEVAKLSARHAAQTAR